VHFISAAANEVINKQDQQKRTEGKLQNYGVIFRSNAIISLMKKYIHLSWVHINFDFPFPP
jgi:hypothetical protein